MQNSLKANISGDHLFRKMCSFGIPIFLALFIQALYGAVDLWAVGRFGNAEDVTAVANGSHFMSLVTALFVGVSVGATIELTEKFAEGDDYASGYIAGACIRVIALFGLVVGLLLIIFAPLVARVMNTPDEAIAKTVLYLRICGIGSIAIALFNLISAIFRAIGDATTPLLFVLVACVFNVILDVVLVEFCHLGTLGVALATVVSQSMSVISAILYIRKFHLPFVFGLKQVETHKGFGRRVLKIGLPVGIQQVFVNCFYVIILAFSNSLGMVVSAGVGIAERVIMFVMLIPLTFMETLTVFVAESKARGDHKTASKSLFIGMISSIVVGLIVFVLFEYFSPYVSQIFTSDKEIIKVSSEFLKATALECLILSMTYCFLGYLNGTKHTPFVMLQGAVGIFCVKLPYAYYAVFLTTPRVYNVALSLEFAGMAQLFLCICYFLIISKDK